MQSADQFNAQLKRIGYSSHFWGHFEIRELRYILMDNETVVQIVNGYYEGGLAMLCATDRRLLLIDKKPMNFLAVEDIRFDMISELDYSYKLTRATVGILTPTKKLYFSSFNMRHLRILLQYVQQCVVSLRQYYYAVKQLQDHGLEGQPTSSLASTSQILQDISVMYARRKKNTEAFPVLSWLVMIGTLLPALMLLAFIFLSVQTLHPFILIWATFSFGGLWLVMSLTPRPDEHTSRTIPSTNRFVSGPLKIYTGGVIGPGFKRPAKEKKIQGSKHTIIIASHY